VAVLRVSGWLALLTRSDRAEDAEILICVTRLPCSGARPGHEGCPGPTGRSRPR